MIQPTNVAPVLFDCLRRMDEEATTLSKRTGRPLGLSDYGRHARPELRKPQCEVEWSRRLAELLNERGIVAAREVPYPERKKTRCDLVVRLGESHKLWIEIKGAWRDYWGGSSLIYRSYLLHPLLSGLDSKSHTVPLDLAKLAALRPPEADLVGELLVGFETPEEPMDEDVASLVSLAGLAAWQLQTDTWISPTVDGQRVRCWFWSREAGL